MTLTSILSLLVVGVIALLVFSLVVEAIPALLKLAVTGILILLLLHLGMYVLHKGP